MELKGAYFNQLKYKLAELYPTREDIRAVLIITGQRQEVVDLNGSAENIWDSALARAEQNNTITDILEYVIDAFKDPELKDVNAKIRNGQAILEEFPIDHFLRNPEINERVKIAMIQTETDPISGKGLEQQLKVLQLGGLIELWSRPAPGELVGENLPIGLREAYVVLLMLTPSFFTDDRCLSWTFSASRMGKHLVPILVSECAWARIRFLKDIQPLPKDYSFISSAAHKSQVEFEVSEEIAKLCEHLIKKGKCR